MTNKILDHIEYIVLEGKRRPAPRGIDFNINMLAPIGDFKSDIQTKVRGELRVYYEQYVDESAPPEVRQLVKERAKAAIARHLYEDVLHGLLDIREEVWAEGIREGALLEKLNELIDTYSGVMSRFE